VVGKPAEVKAGCVRLCRAASKIVSTILRWHPVVLRWLAHEELIRLQLFFILTIDISVLHSSGSSLSVVDHGIKMTERKQQIKE